MHAKLGVRRQETKEQQMFPAEASPTVANLGLTLSSTSSTATDSSSSYYKVRGGPLTLLSVFLAFFPHSLYSPWPIRWRSFYQENMCVGFFFGGGYGGAEGNAG